MIVAHTPRKPSQGARGGRWWLGYLGTTLAIGAVGPVLPGVVQLILYSLVGTSVALAVWAGIRLHRPVRPAAWWMLLTAVSANVLANLSWAVCGVLGVQVPAFSVLDVLYYSMYPLLTVALAILPVHSRYGSALAGMTEAGIITCSAAVLWWTALVDPLIVDPHRLPQDADFVAYPVLDLMLLTMAVRLALISGTKVVSFLFIVASAIALFSADTAYFWHVVLGGDMDGTPFTVIAWMLANALLGSAALHPSMGRVATAGPATAQEGIVALPAYVLMVVLTPVVTGVSLVHEIRQDTIEVLDVAVPLAATTLTAVLVVTRLRQLNRVAQRRATDLDARTTDLEGALRSQADLQHELRHRALHDPLTALPNRTLLHERLGLLLHQRVRGALLIVDLDGFKDVNDRFGHTMGDDLLLGVAQRITELLGPVTFVARPGGDEFAVLLEDVSAAGAAECGGRLLAAMRRPVRVGDHQLVVTVSVGLRHLEPGADTVDMLRDADLALHAAKARGKDQLVAYDEQLREERLTRTRTVERLRGALDRDELVLFYQPVVRLSDERFVAVEALLRWVPQGEPMVPPDRFIPAIEDTGLIVPIGAWVLRQACHDGAAWHRRYGTIISVNVSPRQLREPDYAESVLSALRESGLPPHALTLEITEGVLVDSGTPAEQAIAHLSELRRVGVRVAVDDFGTGYSSLSYLRDLPIDQVKIDKSFMSANAADSAGRILVRAIIDLARGLELGTVAEGVETPVQVRMLRELGCERVQGFYYARPEPAEAVRLKLAAGRPVIPVPVA